MTDIAASGKWRAARPMSAAALATTALFAATACGGTSLPNQPHPTRTSSRTLAVDCEQLVGDRGLMSRALAYANGGVVSADPNNNTDDFRLETQDRLARIVFTGNKKLAGPLGTLVDFLDDPPTYLRSKNLIAKVRRAADKVEKICGQEEAG